MKAWRIVKWSLLILLIVISAGAVSIYIAINGVPDIYQPARLTAAQKKHAADIFLQRMIDLHNQAGRHEPFVWRITQDELNHALASLNEIADKMEKGRAAEVFQVFDKVGAADPAVAIHDDVLTLMVLAKQHNKVLSIDLAFEPTADGQQINVRMVGTRLGWMPVPISVTRDWLVKLQDMLRKSRTGGANAGVVTTSGRMGGLSSEELAEILAGVVGAVDAGPVPAELVINGYRHRVQKVELADKTISLHVVPVGPLQAR